MVKTVFVPIRAGFSCICAILRYGIGILRDNKFAVRLIFVDDNGIQILEWEIDQYNLSHSPALYLACGITTLQ